MKTYFFLCLLVMLGWSGAACGAEPARYQPEPQPEADVPLAQKVRAGGLDWERLEKGMPTTWLEREGELKGRAVGAILINATVEDCWKVLTDWEAMGEWAPMVDYYRIVGRVNDRLIVVGRLKILSITANFTLEVTVDQANKRKSWRQLSDEEVERYREMGIDAVKANWTRDIRGGFKLEPHGAKTLYTYSPHIESKAPIPRFVERLLMRLTLPDWLKAAKERTESSKR